MQNFNNGKHVPSEIIKLNYVSFKTLNLQSVSDRDSNDKVAG